MRAPYEIGDKCWIAISGLDERTEGRVVHKFTLLGWYDPIHYVIEIETELDPLMECRQAITMRRYADASDPP